MKKIELDKGWMAVCLFLTGSSLALGQWQTQSLELKPGWNGVYMHVNSTHSGIAALANGTPVEEVWLWQPRLTTAQYVTSPDAPSDSKSRWVSWKSGLGDASSTLKQMPGNAAYLVKLGGDQNYTWDIKGKPVPPVYQWTTSGLNFLGLPSVETNPKSLEDYFDQAGDLLRVAEIFSYTGGDLGTTNPGQVYGLRTTTARRGQAFWIRSGTKFNRYFGPFEVSLQSPSGASFGENLAGYRVRLRNLTSAALTVTLTGVDSETPPGGEPAITGPAPVLVRGALDTSTLTYAHAALSGGPQAWVLQPFGEVGSEVEVVLGLNRSAMTGGEGAFYAGLLRFTDSLGHSQVDIPVSGSVGSNQGLWVGSASLTQVRHSLSADSTTFGDVASPYPLRLIMHRDQSANVKLMQCVYVGTLPGNVSGIATRENLLLAGSVANAVRISSIHLPASENNLPWTCTGVAAVVAVDAVAATYEDDGTTIKTAAVAAVTAVTAVTGDLKQGLMVLATVEIDHNDHASNPFLHTYHPDHDNLVADFASGQPVGRESYSIKRDIKLTFNTSGNDFKSLTRSSKRLSGIYEETLTLIGLAAATPNEKSYSMKGVFVINRISDIATLTTQ